LLKLGDQLEAERVEIADRFYNAGGDTLINAVRELPQDCHVALLVGHTPGAPGLVHELTDPAMSTPRGSQRDREPVSSCRAGTAGVPSNWSEIELGSLVSVRLPDAARS
jgi:phosphohistidine phosphatase